MTRPALKKQGLWDDLTERAVMRSLRLEGQATIKAPGVKIEVPVPAHFVRLTSLLLSALPRPGMDGIAVSPGDFEAEMDAERIHCKLRRAMLTRLRRTWIVTEREIRAEMKKD